MIFKTKVVPSPRKLGNLRDFFENSPSPSPHVKKVSPSPHGSLPENCSPWPSPASGNNPIQNNEKSQKTLSINNACIILKIKIFSEINRK
ncbi:unnamed protein product [Meloidogyne enterolobii]|uniref:Uncharacterized protein n=1 Tax=Meloidogyne enterolobii TaxID=390850 RepID=A0ACB0Z634_MELEN